MDSTNTFSLKILKPAILLIGLTLISASAQARIKCWENDQGVKECGEKIPPEYSQKGHQVISKHGLTIGESSRAKTKEEREEQERLMEAEQQQEAAKAKKKAEERVLLNTFSNVADIKLTLDQKVADLDSTLRLAHKRTQSIQADLEKRKQRITNIETAGHPVSPALQDDVTALEMQIEENEVFIAHKQQDMEDIKREYARKIKIFNRLKGNK